MQIVILTHDFMYYDRRPCGRWNLEQLRLFLKWAKRLGYEFRQAFLKCFFFSFLPASKPIGHRTVRVVVVGGGGLL